jgi:uncharacterized membrane protein YuzA (DUF378 family)
MTGGKPPSIFLCLADPFVTTCWPLGLIRNLIFLFTKLELCFYEEVKDTQKEKVFMKKHECMHTISIIALILLLIGGISWGLVGAFGVEIISSVFGMGSTLTNIIYILIGISALWKIYTWAKCCK